MAGGSRLLRVTPRADRAERGRSRSCAAHRLARHAGRCASGLSVVQRQMRHELPGCGLTCRLAALAEARRDPASRLPAWPGLQPLVQPHAEHIVPGVGAALNGLRQTNFPIHSAPPPGLWRGCCFGVDWRFTSPWSPIPDEGTSFPCRSRTICLSFASPSSSMAYDRPRSSELLCEMPAHLVEGPLATSPVARSRSACCADPNLHGGSPQVCGIKRRQRLHEWRAGRSGTTAVADAVGAVGQGRAR